MTSETMTAERVLELIETYGAETGAWPDDERAAAAALLAAEPAQFVEALEIARQLDAVLLNEPLLEPGADLTEAILAQAPRATPAPRNLFSGIGALIFPQGVRWPAGAALASLMMGLVGGYAYAAGDSGYEDADSAYYAAFGMDGSDTWVVLE